MLPSIRKLCIMEIHTFLCISFSIVSNCYCMNWCYRLSLFSDILFFAATCFVMLSHWRPAGMFIASECITLWHTGNCRALPSNCTKPLGVCVLLGALFQQIALVLFSPNSSFPVSAMLMRHTHTIKFCALHVY